MVLQNLDAVSSKANDFFRNSEWGPEAAEAMCKEVCDFPVARNNMTLGDLFDRTPKDLISKVMLEEKLFDTWFSDRVVLLGDGSPIFILLNVQLHYEIRLPITDPLSFVC